MKFVRWAVVALIGFGLTPDASAGGFFGGGSGGGYACCGGGYASAYGSSGGGYASSGDGYSAGYASSGGGYSAGYASSGGGYSAGYASSGGGYSAGYASSGGGYASSGGGGLFSRLKAHMAAKRASYASSGGSSGGYNYASYSAGSSGGSSGGYASSYGASSGGYSSYGSSYSAYGGSSGGYSSGYSGSYGASSYGAGSYGSGYSSGYATPGYGTPGYATPGYGVPSTYGTPGYGTSGIPSTGFVSPYSSSMNTAPSYNGARIADTSSSSSQIDAQVVDGDDYASAKPALDDDAALLTVAVPIESAVVTVNGHETTSDGLVRQFMSRGLKDGYLYTYEVVVKYEMDGQARTDSKTIKLRPGDMERLVFTEVDEEAEDADNELGGAAGAKSPETVVRLHVPADARVTLAGNEASGQGETRVFRTRGLAAGQSWDNYTVEVAADIDGRTLVRRQTLNVSAGQQVDLSFDFSSSDLAMN